MSAKLDARLNGKVHAALSLWKLEGMMIIMHYVVLRCSGP